jgi:hypothetical protein
MASLIGSLIVEKSGDLHSSYRLIGDACCCCCRSCCLNSILIFFLTFEMHDYGFGDLNCLIV